MRTIVVTNGHLSQPEKLKSLLPPFDLVICCDGGIRYLNALNLEPNIIIGDFDSADKDLLNEYIENGVMVKRLPVVKNETDTQAAVDLALAYNTKDVTILAGIGTRFDHSYANVMLLIRLVKKGVDARIINSNNVITVSDKQFLINGTPGDIISLLPLTDDVKIENTKGLKYKIQHKGLPLDFPFGISNVFVDSIAEIKVKSGWVMAVIAKD